MVIVQNRSLKFRIDAHLKLNVDIYYLFLICTYAIIYHFIITHYYFLDNVIVKINYDSF